VFERVYGVLTQLPRGHRLQSTHLESAVSSGEPNASVVLARDALHRLTAGRMGGESRREGCRFFERRSRVHTQRRIERQGLG
jgi:hypothetical protein